MRSLKFCKIQSKMLWIVGTHIFKIRWPILRMAKNKRWCFSTPCRNWIESSWICITHLLNVSRRAQHWLFNFLIDNVSVLKVSAFKFVYSLSGTTCSLHFSIFFNLRLKLLSSLNASRLNGPCAYTVVQYINDIPISYLNHARGICGSTKMDWTRRVRKFENWCNLH